MKILNVTARVCIRFLALLILVVFLVRNDESTADDDVVERAVAPAQAKGRDQELDQWVFPVGMTADKLRAQFEKQLTEKISAIDLLCGLSNDQRQKLHLAGSRDIKQIFDRVAALREKKELIETDLKPEAERIRAKSEFYTELAGLRRRFWADTFVSGRDALFTKTLRLVLTDDQRSKTDELTLLRKRIRNVQPDRIDFGTIRVGAIAEANLRIIAQRSIDPDVEVTSEAPMFLKEVQCRLGKPNAVNRGQPTECTVAVSLSTSQPGKYHCNLKVLIGDDMFADIPIAASVLAHEPGLRRLLVVETPFHRYSTDSASRFDPWLDVVRTTKIDVSYLEHRKNGLCDLDLSRYDAILLSESGVYAASTDDFERLATFVEAGGRAIVAASAHYDGSVAKANEFISRFGMTIENFQVDPECTIEIDSSRIAIHELTKSVHTLKFFRPSPVSIVDSNNGLMLVRAPADPNSGFVAMVKVGRGSVVVLGTTLWWNWIGSDREKGADNTMLLRNLICTP